MDTFKNAHDFYHFIMWYDGELIIRNNRVFNVKNELVAEYNFNKK